jgi:hypothetical protein
MASAPAAPGVAPPQPTLQLPTDSPAPPPAASPSLVSQPVVEQPAQTAAPVETASAPAKTVPARSAASRQATRLSVSTPTVPTTRGVPTPQPQAARAPLAAQPMPPAASLPLAHTAVAPAPVLREAPDDTRRGVNPLAWIAALFVLLGAGTVLVAMRSRRRRVSEAYGDAYGIEPAETEQVFAPAPLPVFAPAENVAVEAIEPTPHPSAAQQIGSAEFVAAPTAEPAPFVMPAGPVPEARAERDALLEEMVAARPDAENPFTSRKARLRRARIILQSREQHQKEDATKPFDWRTYRPSTSHPAPATPPRVTV